MWTISSNDVQQAKDRLDRRRIEIEARYAEDKKALDAENAMIETLERTAAAFAQRLIPENPATPAVVTPADGRPEPMDPAEPSAYAAAMDQPAPVSDGEPVRGAEAPVKPAGYQSEPDAAAPGTTQTDPPEDDAAVPFDILKPGSRWRFNRATRLLNPESSPVNPPSTS